MSTDTNRPFIVNGGSKTACLTVAIIEEHILDVFIDTIQGKNPHACYTSKYDFRNTAKEVYNDIIESGDYTISDLKDGKIINLILVYNVLDNPPDTLAVSEVLGFVPEYITIFP